MSEATSQLRTAIKKLWDYKFITVKAPQEISEETFNDNIKWVVGEDENGSAVFGARPSDVTWEKVKAEIDKTAYLPKRVEGYPSWQEQMDMQYHDAVDGTTTWQDAVKAVKDANPKP